MSEITENELQLISELRDRISDVHLDRDLNSNIYIVRFLRARDYNLKDAEQMQRKHVEWIIEKCLSTILDWEPPKLLVNELQYEMCGVDKTGVPLLLIPLGQWDVKGAIESGGNEGKEIYVRYVYFILKKCLKVLLERSPFHQFVLLMVPDGLQTLRQMSSVQVLESMVEICRAYEANYPETLKAAFIVDVPRLFSMGYRIVKPLMHSRTLAKINISSNPNVWKPELLELIEADQLPPRLGGTRQSFIDIFNKTT